VGTNVLYIAQNIFAFLSVTSKTIKQIATTHSCAKKRLKYVHKAHMKHYLLTFTASGMSSKQLPISKETSNFPILAQP
jgi:hypothetical protein